MLKNQLKELKDAVGVLKTDYETTQSEMKEHGNKFAKEHEEYFDIAELHMARLEQVMMEEL